MNSEFSQKLLHKLLAFFNRRNLCLLSITCRRFRDIINSDFATAPYMVKPLLRLAYDNWFQDSELMIKLKALQTLEFCRYAITQILFGPDEPPPMKVLPQMAHFWKEQSLSIQWCNTFLRDRIEFVPTAAFAQLVATSSHLMLCGGGSISVLRELLVGSCEQIIITDVTYEPTMVLPLAELVDFLYKNGCQREKKLSIRTSLPPSRCEFEEIIKCVKERFETTTTRALFELHFAYEDYYEHPDSFVVRNATIGQNLRLVCYSSGLRLTTEFSEDDSTIPETSSDDTYHDFDSDSECQSAYYFDDSSDSEEDIICSIS
ncbi:hypothetical protein Ddc_03587 [Ditylenchus destructor]|nr:hypothetical protein Ddc_03587 [Ditylenchus destructor]